LISADGILWGIDVFVIVALGFLTVANELAGVIFVIVTVELDIFSIFPQLPRSFPSESSFNTQKSPLSAPKELYFQHFYIDQISNF
jgi:hypothetical protein